jgi:hypothetical protein
MSRPSRFTPGKDAPTPLNRRLCEPQGRSEWVRKIYPRGACESQGRSEWVRKIYPRGVCEPHGRSEWVRKIYPPRGLWASGGWEWVRKIYPPPRGVWTPDCPARSATMLTLYCLSSVLYEMFATLADRRSVHLNVPRWIFVFTARTSSNTSWHTLPSVWAEYADGRVHLVGWGTKSCLA